VTLIPSSIDNNSDDKRARLLVKLAESQIFSNLKKPHNEHLESGERCGPAVWVRGRGGCVHEAGLPWARGHSVRGGRQSADSRRGPPVGGTEHHPDGLYIRTLKICMR